MKVWIVLDNYGSCPSDQDTSVAGVFLTEDAAIMHVADLEAQDKIDIAARGEANWMYATHGYSVDEHEVQE